MIYKTDAFIPLDGESWRRVSENLMLSNFGRWYAIQQKKIIKQRPNRDGYMRACCRLDGKVDIFTHIKVVVYFGDRYGKTFYNNLISDCLSIDHVDGDKTNNRQSNLEIVTHKENCRRKFDKPKERIAREKVLEPSNGELPW